MGKKDQIDSTGRAGLSRRDFLKASAAATAVAAAGVDFAVRAPNAFAANIDPADLAISFTTCPYCSASCGQRVVVDKRAGSATENQVIDIYGDVESPWNNGGLCSKGAGAYQLVMNKRRLGAYAGTHPTGNAAFAYQSAFTDGVAYKRVANGTWSTLALDDALHEIVEGDGANNAGLVAYRGTPPKKTDSFTLFSATDIAPETFATVPYYGFAAVKTFAAKDNIPMIAVGACKQKKADFPAWLAGATDPLDPISVAARGAEAFDELIFACRNQWQKDNYVFVGTSDAKAKLLAANSGVPAQGGQAFWDAALGLYRGFLTDLNGSLHELRSPDMLTWTYYVNHAAPTGVALSQISVVKKGSTLHVWAEYLEGAVYKLGYAPLVLSSTATPGSWSPTMTELTIGGSTISGAYGTAPSVSWARNSYTDDYAWTIFYSKNGIKTAKTLTASATPDPAVFGAITDVVDDTAGSERSLAHGTEFVAYQVGSGATGEQFGDIKAYIHTGTYNSRSVAFFGSSHMNNEQNHTYRKLIADFGTSNTEHQARI
ncbi:MAG: twin-arginine translocation signal domain-containing protein [Coriobacteriia bacterium]|nr:twin-arginine translocation signal domain-containing protein [Coriobacteriia bacterium]